MDCPIKTQENTDWLLDYAAGRLQDDRAAQLERHVEMCQACAHFVEAQQLVWSALEQWEPEPVSLDFDRRLYGRIDQAKPSSRLPRILRRAFGPLQSLWRPVVPLAAACLLIVAGVVLHAPRAVIAPRGSQARVEKIEPEQVERTLDDMQMLRELEVTLDQGGHPSKSM
jgi:anti-sigma factor RsiW